MVTLTHSEIIEVLMSLGITSLVDLNTYSREYTLYFNRQYSQTSAPHK